MNSMFNQLESHSKQWDVVIAYRDPTEKDQNYCFLWWNISRNRFFKFISEIDGRYIWEYLEEKRSNT